MFPDWKSPQANDNSAPPFHTYFIIVKGDPLLSKIAVLEVNAMYICAHSLKCTE